MTRIDELMLELNNYEKQMLLMWSYWDDVLRSWKMLERGRIIRRLQEEQIKEFVK